MSKPDKKKRRIFKLGKKKLLLVVAIIILGAGAWYWQSNRPVVTDPEGVVTYSTDEPDEEKPGDEYVWRGGPDDPKYIKLSTIGAEGFIQKVGVDQRKQVAVPNNIHIAGWFVNSVKPGNKGLSIIDGHVNGRKNDGIFKDLPTIKENDTYTVEFGNGSVKEFRVLKLITVTTAEAPNVLFSQNPKVKNQLNLITCVGNFDSKSRTYDQRMIVYSEQI